MDTGEIVKTLSDLGVDYFKLEGGIPGGAYDPTGVPMSMKLQVTLKRSPRNLYFTTRSNGGIEKLIRSVSEFMSETGGV